MSKRALVFVVDDHPLVRQGLAALITQQDDLRFCGEAEDAEQALERIAALKPDIVVVDLTLKGMSGFALTRDIRALFPAVGVVILSMHDEVAYAERALLAGAHAYVMKTQNPAVVIEAVRAVRRGEIHLSTRVMRLVAASVVRKRRPEEPIQLLSERELEIFRLLGQGYETADIAGMLHVSKKTVHAYYERMRRKLKVPNSTQLQLEAVRHHEGIPAAGTAPT
jgi:DNA-binding NarL/FixJ family response regulator